MSGATIMARIIEWAQGHLSTRGHERHALYCHMIDVLEQLGYNNLDECCELDTHFEEAYQEMHSWEEEETNGNRGTETDS